MGFFADLIENLAPVVLAGVQTLADGLVKGETLNKDQKQTLYSGYVLMETWGDDLVESTENTYDDAALESLASFCKDTLEEAGIQVPIIPEELLEAPRQDDSG